MNAGASTLAVVDEHGRPMFTDADLDHRWAAEHRIPVVASPPSWRYEAALLVPNYAEGGTPDPDQPRYVTSLYDAIWPTDEEAAVIGSYIEHRVQHWYNDSWQARMRARALDVDSGTNTVTFRKKADGWTYTRATYDHGMFYPVYSKPQYAPTKAGLIELIATRLHTFGSGSISKDFAEWMDARPEVWAF